MDSIELTPDTAGLNPESRSRSPPLSQLPRSSVLLSIVRVYEAGCYEGFRSVIEVLYWEGCYSALKSGLY